VLDDRRPELVHVQSGGVDHVVGQVGHLAEQTPLDLDATLDRALGRQGVHAARLAVAVHQHLDRCVQEDQLERHPPGAELSDQIRERRQELDLPGIERQGDLQDRR
jgi:hypothetical protein